MKVTPNIDLFASRVGHQLKPYMSRRLDPNSIAVDVLQQSWRTNLPYIPPPPPPISALFQKCLRKIEKEEISALIVTPLWPTAIWYTLLLNMCIRNPLPLTKGNELTDKPTRGDTSINKKWNTRLSSVVHFRESLIKEGISGKAASLMSSARRQGALSAYDSSWKKWCLWCSERNVDPFRCNLTFVLAFLSRLFEKRLLEYRTIGVYRSAISAYHHPH